MNVFDLADNHLIRNELAERVEDWDKLRGATQITILVDVTHRFTHGGIPHNQMANFVTNYVVTVESYHMWQDRASLTLADIWEEWASMLRTLNYV